MAQKLTAQIVEDVILGGGFTVRFAAVSPTDGSAVSGVTVSNVEVTGAPQAGGGAETLQLGPFMLVPGPGA